MKNLDDSISLLQAVLPKNLLAQAFRLAEDIERRHANTIARNLDGDPDFILQAGYRIASSGFSAIIRQLASLPDFVAVRRTILLPCLNISGDILDLHDQSGGQWVFGPTAHIANPKWAGSESVRICRTTSEADPRFLAQNVCAVEAHGLRLIDLLRQLSGERMGVAA